MITSTYGEKVNRMNDLISNFSLKTIERINIVSTIKPCCSFLTCHFCEILHTLKSMTKERRVIYFYFLKTILLNKGCTYAKLNREKKNKRSKSEVCFHEKVIRICLLFILKISLFPKL